MASPLANMDVAEFKALAMRKVYMVFSASLFLFMGTSYNLVFLGRILPASGEESSMVIRLVFNLILGLALWSYFSAHASDPGTAGPEWRKFVLECGNGLAIVCPRDEWQPRKATFCRRCNLPRPERAHHCRMCGKCVLRYDHHCPWTDNCVGINNHKMFLLAMIYGCCASWIALYTAFPKLLACWSATWEAASESEGQLPRLASALVAFESQELTPEDLIAFYILCIFCVFLGTVLGWLLTIHFPLALNNCTSVEGNYDNMPNPFDLGDRVSNLAQVFGRPGFDWLLPVRPFRPMCDGIAFPTQMSGPEGIIGNAGEHCSLLAECASNCPEVSSGMYCEDPSGAPIGAESAAMSESFGIDESGRFVGAGADGGAVGSDAGAEVTLRWRRRYNVPLPRGASANGVGSGGSSPSSSPRRRAAAGWERNSSMRTASASPLEDVDGKQEDMSVFALARWLDPTGSLSGAPARPQEPLDGAPMAALGPPVGAVGPEGQIERSESCGLGQIRFGACVKEGGRKKQAAKDLEAANRGGASAVDAAYPGARQFVRTPGEEELLYDNRIPSRGSNGSNGGGGGVFGWLRRAAQAMPLVGAGARPPSPHVPNLPKGHRTVIAL